MTAQILLILRLVVTLSLYLFFGVALYLIWQELRRHARLSAIQPPRVMELVLLRELEELRRMRFTASEVVIGRDPACDCIVDDPTVSAQHARLSFRQGHWWLEDMRSTNGTYLNLEAVFSPVVVAAGDQIRCGQVSLSVVIESTATQAFD